MNSTAKFSSADLKTWREAAGLSQTAAAALFHVNQGAFASWEHPGNRRFIHADVVEWFLEYRQMVTDRIDDILHEVESLEAEHGTPKVVDLIRYSSLEKLIEHHPSWKYPLACHDAMIARIMEALEFEGYRVKVHWDEIQDYSDFIQKRGWRSAEE